MQKKLELIAGDLEMRSDQCIVVCVLSHGVRVDGDDKIVGRDGEFLSIFLDFLKPLTADQCVNFRGPRLVFFQCCRNGKADYLQIILTWK